MLFPVCTGPFWDARIHILEYIFNFKWQNSFLSCNSKYTYCTLTSRHFVLISESYDLLSKNWFHEIFVKLLWEKINILYSTIYRKFFMTLWFYLEKKVNKNFHKEQKNKNNLKCEQPNDGCLNSKWSQMKYFCLILHNCWKMWNIREMI